MPRLLFPTLISLGPLVTVLLGAESARAEPLRLHAGVEAGRALSGHQKRELGWGGDLFGAIELPVVGELGIELELGGAWLSAGEPPQDPNLAAIDSATGLWAALGMQVRPFLRRYQGSGLSPAGLWASAAAGAARTGGATRPLFDLRLGWDWLMAGGQLGIGPVVSCVHVGQPDSELRPADANLLFFGAHLLFDSGPGVPAPVDGDRDRDRVRDSVDRCPEVPEDPDDFEDTDGCPDLDNDRDGIPDPSDRCPNNPEDRDGFEDTDGCPDLDNDQDGIRDRADRCPSDPEDKDDFEDTDGCPDPDNDRDAVPDLQDLCPNEPETKNGYADGDGCPDEEQVRVVGDKIVLDERIHFATNNAQIRPLSYPLLGRLAKLIREHPEYVHIHIEGHADTRGPEEFNQWLSEERAKSVLRFLVKHEIAESRLSSEGFGATKPLVDSRDERSWFLNRRVEFKVTREMRAERGSAPATDALGSTERATSPRPTDDPSLPPAGEPPGSRDKEDR
jgi:outer membrane protein OmpA-like peptidoglycan-associated protein